MGKKYHLLLNLGEAGTETLFAVRAGLGYCQAPSRLSLVNPSELSIEPLGGILSLQAIDYLRSLGELSEADAKESKMPRKEINLRIEVLGGGYCVNGEEWSRELLADCLARQSKEGNKVIVQSVPSRRYANWKK